MVLQNLLADARKARLANDYGAAISLCSAYLTAHPGDAEGESLLGLCEIESGKPQGAMRIESAAARNPRSHTIQHTLSILREKQGDIRAAVQSAAEASRLAPNAFECWAQLGKLLGMVEKYAESIAALEQARKINPDHAGVLLLIAGAALETGDFDHCEGALAQIEKSAAGAETIRLRAHLARKRGDWSRLQIIAMEWMRLDPAGEEARIALAHAQAQQGYFDEAAETYGPLCAGKKPPPHHAAAMGRYRLGGRHLGEARKWFEAALFLDPQNAEAAYGLARLSHFSGDAAETEKWCRQALQSDPGHADAFALLAESAKGERLEADLAAVDAALSAPRLRQQERISMLFAKGDFLHSLKRAEDAFAAWSAANEAKKAVERLSGSTYSPAGQEQKVSRLIELFPDLRSGPSPARKGAQPIFIVGMPRSGTTLLEAAISAHPDVDAAGEVPALPFILDEFLTWAGETGFRAGDDIPERKADEWRSLYFAQARRFGARSAAFFTDKQPSNFLSVGLVARLFPAARVLYLRRNPVETGFSVFRRNFTQQWAFSTGLDTVAHYYAEHCRISDHWLETAPDRVKFIQYEDFVENFEPALRDVIEFCGLEWDDRCLSYYESDRSVITFSAAQVRKPPSAAHLNSTAPYARMLAPLADALAGYGVDLKTGARNANQQKKTGD